MAERRDLGATVEPQGRRVEAASEIQRLEAGTEVTESSEEEGRRGGRSVLQSIKSQSINSPFKSSSPKSIFSSPSAIV